MEIITAEGSIRVAELSQLFQVTEETIRRDLDKLEAEGKIQRTHGGAVSGGGSSLEVPFSEREIERIEEKMKIAVKAVELIHPGEMHAIVSR